MKFQPIAMENRLHSETIHPYFSLFVYIFPLSVLVGRFVLFSLWIPSEICTQKLNISVLQKMCVIFWVYSVFLTRVMQVRDKNATDGTNNITIQQICHLANWKAVVVQSVDPIKAGAIFFYYRCIYTSMNFLLMHLQINSATFSFLYKIWPIVFWFLFWNKHIY